MKSRGVEHSLGGEKIIAR